MESIFHVQSRLRSELGLHKVRAVPNHKFKRHGTKAYASALNRYGFKPTKPGPYSQLSPRQDDTYWYSGKYAVGALRTLWTSLVGQSEKDAPTGEVPAEDQQNDIEYLCEVLIGTPPQKILLDFDTGSADLWVRKDLFHPEKSSTFEILKGMGWKIQYGDGSNASGSVGVDTVSIGGIVIKKQAVEVADNISSQFSEGVIGGLLGLAFSKINTCHTYLGTRDPQPTPVENMITQEDIPKEAELFTTAFYSSRDQQEKSFYTFGFIDQDLVRESGQEIAWADVDNSQGFWMFDSQSATVAGEKIALSGNKAIADTGTTLALVSDQACEALYKKIKGATYSEKYQGYIIPKTTAVDDLPDFSIDVGGKEFTVQKEDILFTSADEENWYGGIQSRGENPFDILGDTFLKSIYAIWDQGHNRFGAVPKIEKKQSEPLSSGEPGLGGKTMCQGGAPLPCSLEASKY
ncbi:aspartic peptidase domain-containing protein [Podospora australis]|uniref:Aspartic peptidase domain-containing protein n=1 Tax=Podospora australis TaxID=1536484 RepID=A0AAN6X3K6_9PEZI|nr:aspartic peptidase domain-containing protein [Podospora australis]